MSVRTALRSRTEPEVLVDRAAFHSARDRPENRLRICPVFLDLVVPRLRVEHRGAISTATVEPLRSVRGSSNSDPGTTARR